MVSDSVEVSSGRVTASRISKVEYRMSKSVKESRQRKTKSIPLLPSLILSLGPVRARSIASTSCCTFRSRAQPIFGDYSVSHPVSILFSSRPASSKHTKREEENSLTRNRTSETLTSYHFLQRHGWYRECQHQLHWHHAQ
jgi:hypothetical protein